MEYRWLMWLLPSQMWQTLWFTACHYGSILIVVKCFRGSTCVPGTCSFPLSLRCLRYRKKRGQISVVCFISFAFTLLEKSLLKDFPWAISCRCSAKIKRAKSNAAQIVISNRLVLSRHVHCKNAFCLQLWFESVEHEFPPHVVLAYMLPALKEAENDCHLTLLIKLTCGLFRITEP